MASFNSRGEAVNWARGKIIEVEDGAVEALEAAMQDGAETAIGIIATSGTPKSGRAGRIDTKNMISKVKHRVDRMRRGRARGFFGWLGAWNNPDDKYFAYQEGGFEHYKSGEWITGMYAMRDAADYAMESLRRRMAAISQKSSSSGPKRRIKMM